MATKHIKDTTWRAVEKKTVEAVIETKMNIKDTEMLDYLINLGLKSFQKEDYHKVKQG
ncbi:hypothetical protein [Vibrio cholerae]|uniref:hypothetical protein n=1 Tax=Vibrio cholerae TaxID=666 RepID=UPI0001D5A8E7|nr:hypothetical protein [Vibrio cholerae]EFH75473.1 conserved hypothetical protein [Vibrio cholerae RC385]